MRYLVVAAAAVVFAAAAAAAAAGDILKSVAFSFVAATLQYFQVRLHMTVTAVEEDGDEWVYGFPDYLPLDYYGSCVGTTAAGSTSDCIVWSTGSGKSDIAGAYTSLSGYASLRTQTADGSGEDSGSVVDMKMFVYNTRFSSSSPSPTKHINNCT